MKKSHRSPNSFNTLSSRCKRASGATFTIRASRPSKSYWRRIRSGSVSDTLMAEPYERTGAAERDYRNGTYARDLVTRFGTIRIRIARTRQKGFRPRGLEAFQRRAEEVALLIREAFLRGSDAASRAGDWSNHRRSCQCADGLEDHAESGSDGEGVSRKSFEG